MLVMAGTEGSENPSSAIAVYRAASPSGVTQVACSLGGYPYTRLAFQAEAGETYFFQLGTFLYRGGKFLPSPGGPGAAGYDEAGSVALNVTQLPTPSCPAPEFTVADPFGDTFPPPPVDPGYAVHDITRVSGAADRQNFCFTIEFAEAIDPPGSGGDGGALLSLDIDVDNNPSTGDQSSVDYSCGAITAALGVDTQVNMDTDGGILVPIYQNFYSPPLPDGGVPEQPYALALSGERRITLVVPLREIGRDDIFDFAVLVHGDQYLTTDCAPNGGHIRSPNPARPGDVNCDGRTNSIDAMLIMRSYARLLVALPCAYAGDVNGNGGLGPLDAILILQYDAGLVDALPPVPHSALEAAIRETGRRLEVLRGLLTVESKEAMQWPDSCLGLAEEGEACLQVVTPGFRIAVRTAPGSGLPLNVLTWRTNADGSNLRLESWAVE
jgi:hypothetical protein